MPQFGYVLTNEAIPGIVKIDLATHGVASRLSGLNSHSGKSVGDTYWGGSRNSMKKRSVETAVDADLCGSLAAMKRAAQRAPDVAAGPARQSSCVGVASSNI